jgi:hypothetical protein
MAMLFCLLWLGLAVSTVPLTSAKPTCDAAQTDGGASCIGAYQLLCLESLYLHSICLNHSVLPPDLCLLALVC